MRGQVGGMDGRVCWKGVFSHLVDVEQETRSS